MKKINRKLSLSSTTIRNLAPNTLGAIIGGISTPSFIYSCDGPRGPGKCSEPGSGMTCPTNVAC